MSEKNGLPRYMVVRNGRRGNRHYWQPSSELRARGAGTERLSNNLADAILRAIEINEALDQSRARGAPLSLNKMTRRQRADASARSNIRQGVYVIRGPGGLHKIGVAADPLKRLSTLNVGSGFQLELLFFCRLVDAANVERDAHLVLSEKRGSGEWFAVPSGAAIAAVLSVLPISAYQLGDEA